MNAMSPSTLASVLARLDRIEIRLDAIEGRPSRPTVHRHVPMEHVELESALAGLGRAVDADCR
jgi:hypothetical protein